MIAPSVGAGDDGTFVGTVVGGSIVSIGSVALSSIMTVRGAGPVILMFAGRHSGGS